MKEVERYRNKKQMYLTMSFVISENTLLVHTFVFVMPKSFTLLGIYNIEL